MLRALAHPAHLRILAMLRSGGLCVCQVAAAMGSPVSTVSEHLGELRRAGLVLERREGRWVSYSLADEAPALFDHIWGLIGSDPLVRQEQRLVRRLRRLPVTELCDAGLDLARSVSSRPPEEKTNGDERERDRSGPGVRSLPRDTSRRAARGG